MTKRLSVFALVFAAVLPLAAFASEGPETLEANTHLKDQDSLHRGATLFMNYCSGCHSLKYMRYSRMAEDLGLTEDQVAQNFIFTGAKPGEHINVSMNPTDAAAWLGKTPPATCRWKLAEHRRAGLDATPTSSRSTWTRRGRWAGTTRCCRTHPCRMCCGRCRASSAR